MAGVAPQRDESQCVRFGKTLTSVKGIVARARYGVIRDHIMRSRAFSREVRLSCCQYLYEFGNVLTIVLDNLSLYIVVCILISVMAYGAVA